MADGDFYIFFLSWREDHGEATANQPVKTHLLMGEKEQCRGVSVACPVDVFRAASLSHNCHCFDPSA